MSSEMDAIRELILSGSKDSAAYERLPLPATMRAITTHKSEEKIFEGVPSRDKDPRKSLHVDHVPLPEVGANEALVAVMASSINFNTVWTSIFEPLSTFRFLERAAKKNPASDGKHDLPYHIIGSDGSGVVLRVGPGVTKWKAGDRVTIHCNYVDMQSPEGHDDSMMDPDQRIWGFETNFGGLAEIALVRANQLMPKAEHLAWEEAASMPLVNSTAYRMLVSPNGYQIKQGDIVLIWGAVGGLGGFALQYCLNGGAFPIAVVSSEEREKVARTVGARWVINRKAEGYQFWNEDGTQNIKELRRFGKKIRELTGGEDPDVVFEHPGRATFGASVFVTRPGGVIVTCASTTGYDHTYDNRYLWMNKKKIIGSHFANYREAW
ncbi:MAG: crotonyl-CoA carboxylase/reductase, partial [Myxococcales bacterium]|nr:crotonyl-CoA carboxylase/reductase [Myxococcales bacterium]